MKFQQRTVIFPRVSCFALAFVLAVMACASTPKQNLDPIVYPRPPEEARFYWERPVVGTGAVKTIGREQKLRSLLTGLRKLLVGELGTEQLRGPITIVQIARKSLDIGWQAYLVTMIFISINLGILNLLPIPILDGGQILIASIEGIKRAPISLRTREMVQQLGFIVLMMLMGLAFFNDLSGQWAKFVAWLSTDL